MEHLSPSMEYDGYAECVRTIFDPNQVTVARLVEYLFEIIDPYSLYKQGPDVGKILGQAYTVNLKNISKKQNHGLDQGKTLSEFSLKC